jgi:hypothetical protein
MIYDLFEFDFDLNNELLIVDLSSIKNFNAKNGSEIGAKLQKVFIDSTKIEKMKSLVNTRILSEHHYWSSISYLKGLYVVLKNDLDFVDCEFQIEFMKRNKIHLNLYYSFQITNFLNKCENYLDIF